MKTIIVTGSGGNLGKAICKRFLQSDYRVIGTVTKKDQSSLAGNKNFVEEVLDLSAADDVEKFVNSTVAEHGNIDVAVLTVGGFVMGRLAETSIVDLQTQYKLNFETTFNLARPVFIQMLKQAKGYIFLTGARTGSDMRLSKGSVAYGLSKSLIFRLAEIMNEEAKGTGIVTSVISPSTIDTPQNRAGMPDANFDKWVKADAIAEVVYNATQPGSEILREPILKVYNNA